MSVNQKIIEALSPFHIPVVPDQYDGKEKKYVTFQYADDRATVFGDDEPRQIVAYMQIHLFLPMDENFLKIKREMRKALFYAGFTYPTVTILTEPENNIRHIVFECEIEDEI